MIIFYVQAYRRKGKVWKPFLLTWVIFLCIIHPQGSIEISKFPQTWGKTPFRGSLNATTKKYFLNPCNKLLLNERQKNNNLKRYWFHSNYFSQHVWQLNKFSHSNWKNLKFNPKPQNKLNLINLVFTETFIYPKNLAEICMKVVSWGYVMNFYLG